MDSGLMVTKVNGNSTSTFGGAISTSGAVTASNVGAGNVYK
jgi:predicted outer membrane repeat protein